MWNAREASSHKQGQTFNQSFTHQDAAILNVTRACEAAVDLANMLVRKRRLGVPAESRESFILLEQSKVIAPELSARLRKLIGFRNIAVHQYQDLDLNIVEAVIRDSLDDLLALAEVLRPQLESS